MLIVALVLAVISLAALVTAVVTSNELIAWACIGFSALGVLLLIVDAIRDRNRRPVRSSADAVLAAETTEVMAPVALDGDEETYDDETVEDYPEEMVYDDPDHDLPDDDEPSYPIAAEEAAIHIVSDEELEAQADSDEMEYDDVETAVERDASGSYTVIYSGEAVPGEASSETTVPDESSSETTVPDESSSETTVPGESSSETTVPGESSNAVPDEPSYIVTESPTVSSADSQADADDSIVVIYSSEYSEEERGGER